MRRRWAFGLRPRLLAALVFTAAVTLGVAALALLPPLQNKLTRQARVDLENATSAETQFFEQRIVANFKQTTRIADRKERLTALSGALYGRATTLHDRTGARVIVTDSVSTDDPIVDTDFAGSTIPQREILRALIAGFGRSVRSGDDVIVTRIMTVRTVDKNQPDHTFVLVTEKPLTDVTSAVGQVRTAFLAAAAVGLLVAVILGVLLATTIGRRLARLRAAAVRVAREGPDAPTPRDDGLDEVGDLARSLATMQRELRRQEASRRSFVATASHELRTPLTSLQGTLELLEEDLRDGRLDHDDARQQLVAAQRQLRRLGRLASELLDLSRLDAAVALREEPVELGELCRAVAAEFELAARDRGIELEVTAPPGPCWGRGDPDAVARVVRILLDNALRHAPVGSVVRVLPAYHGSNATVEVADEGPGVAPADRERIFERFERGSTPSGEGGFGLGLAIGRELARRMGGELRHDDGTDPGARFVLELAIEMPSGSHAEREPAPTTG
ncbi:MAG: two-component system, OmpR family, sensor histidine kinase MprB [Solirubrobacteraceae bacterium]